MKFLVLGFLILGSPFLLASKNAQLRENLYEQARYSILKREHLKSLFFSPFQQQIYVDALWDLAEEKEPSAIEVLEEESFFHFDLEERFRLELISLKATGKKLSKTLINEVYGRFHANEASLRLIYLIASYESEILKEKLSDLVELAKQDERYGNVIKKGALESPQALKDLLGHDPQVEGLRTYLLCRSNRLYSCLMLLKDENHEFVKNKDGSIWVHQGLALSSRGLPSHQRNGNTPAGIWKINSVMPEANEQLSFGKFRRLIMEFIPASQDEEELKKYLPESSHHLHWWYPSVVARDVGRNDFRIHGSGKINKDPTSSFYPFIRTAGCIAQRENTYKGVTYKDQRLLLDKMMEALNLEVTFPNETLIKGTLYVIEIDDEKSPVTLAELQEKGIL
jgi:hypothetical protein